MAWSLPTIVTMQICGELTLDLGGSTARLRFSETDRGLHVDTVFVPKPHRSAGIGTALMQRVLALADALAKPIWLDARPIDSSSAEALQRLVRYYERLGFIARSRRAGSVEMERPAPVCG
jgi:GNAT superfamily N-acetyltransferase